MASVRKKLGTCWRNGMPMVRFMRHMSMGVTATARNTHTAIAMSGDAPPMVAMPMTIIVSWMICEGIEYCG